jgi:MoaA/NifB/PqqE/SkfB family radical SAM enzyme
MVIVRKKKPDIAIGIEVKVTDHCNQRCFHCVNMDDSGSGHHIDHDLVIERLYQWGKSDHGMSGKIKEVRFTGGEPLLNMQALIAMARCCAELGIRSGVNTNGSLITEDTAHRLKGTGVAVIKISLDAMQEDIHQKIRQAGTGLNACLHGIHIAVAKGFKVIVRFTLSRLNSSQIIACYEFAEKSGVSKFQVKPLINAGRARGSNQFLSKNEIGLVLQKLVERSKGSPMVPEILCWPPDGALGMESKACGSIHKIYISTDGKVCTCNFLAPGWEADLKTDSLKEIFDSRLLNLETQEINGCDVLANCPQYCNG